MHCAPTRFKFAPQLIVNLRSNGFLNLLAKRVFFRKNRISKAQSKGWAFFVFGLWLVSSLGSKLLSYSTSTKTDA